MNPNQAVRVTAPATPASPRPSGGSTACPECGRDVEGAWRFCPHCNADLRGSKRTRPASAELDVEINKDMRGSAVGLGCFTVIGLIGFALFLLFLFSAGSELLFDAPVTMVPIVMVIVFTAMVLVVGFWVMKADSQARHSQATPQARSGLATVLYVIASVGVVFLCVVFVLFLFLLVVCANYLATHR
jgi:hypothetical protein